MVSRKRLGLAIKRSKFWVAIESFEHAPVLRLTCLTYKEIQTEKKNRNDWKNEWKEYYAWRNTAFRTEFSCSNLKRLPMWIIRWNKFWKAVHSSKRVALCLTFMAYHSIQALVKKRTNSKTKWNKERKRNGIDGIKFSRPCYDEWTTDIEEDIGEESSSGPSCSEIDIDSSGNETDSPCESADESEERNSSSKTTEESESEDDGPFVNRGRDSEDPSEPETDEDVELETDEEIQEEPRLEADDCTLQFPMDPVTMKRFEKIIEKSQNWTEKQKEKGFAKWGKKNPDLMKKLNFFFKDDTAMKHHHDKLRLRRRPYSVIIGKILTVLFVLLVVEHLWTTYGNQARSNKK